MILQRPEMNDISNDIRHGGYIRAEEQSNIITKEIYVTMLYVYHTFAKICLCYNRTKHLRTIAQILIFNRYTNISAAHWLITI